MAEDVDAAALETDNPTDTQTDVADKGATDATAEGATGDTTKDVTPDWSEDWRAKIAGDDAKLLKRLERFQSPADVTKSWLALESKMQSKDVKMALPENATDDQVAEYRKQNGIPESAEGYLEKLPDGLVIGEADKPLVDSFLQSAHAKHADPAIVGDMIGWYYSQQEELIGAQAEADKAAAIEAEETLRAEWGAEYRGNQNAMHNFLAQTPVGEGGSLADTLLAGRLADGTLIRNSPDVIKWLTKLSNDANPAGFIAPGSGLSQVEGVKEEIASIEKVMRTNRRAYDSDTKMQARLRDLYDAEEKLSK